MSKKFSNPNPLLTAFLTLGGLATLFLAIKLGCDGHYFSDDGKLNLGTLGNVGGFLGGITGIVSIVLLYRTLHQSQIQQFESVYFGMLSTLREHIVDTKDELIQRGKSKRSLEGSKYYSELLASFKEELNSSYQKVLFPQINQGMQVYLKDEVFTKEYILYVYDKVYNDNQSALSHFFRYLYNIIKFVDHKTLLSAQQKEDYLNFIATQLSNDILALVFYNISSNNGINKKGEHQFKEWVLKYNLLENIHPSSLMQRSHDFEVFYPNSKFRYQITVEEKKQAEE